MFEDIDVDIPLIYFVFDELGIAWLGEDSIEMGWGWRRWGEFGNHVRESRMLV